MVLHRTTARLITPRQRASQDTRGHRPPSNSGGRVTPWSGGFGPLGGLPWTACAVLIAGCAGNPGGSRAGAIAAGEPVRDPIQAFLEGDTLPAGSPDPASDRAEAPARRAQDEARRQAERLVAAMQAESAERSASPQAQGGATLQGSTSPVAGAHALQTDRASTFTQPQDPWAAGARSDRSSPRQVVRQAPGRIEPLPASQTAARPEATDAAPEAASPEISPAPDRRELIDRLLRDIRRSDGPDLLRAAQISAIGVISDEQELRLSDFSNLTPRQTDLVRAFDRVLTETARQFASGRRDLAFSEVFDDWRDLEGERPVQIRDMKLCRRVSGYGVYDAFDEQRFLAGQEQAVIVYVELDHFTPRQIDQGEFEVKLSQSVTLYNAQDGLEVWRQPEEEIVDRSRNRRRDFFVVQLIRLPARLSVGKYVLKARVTDQYGGSVAEQSTRLEIVADTAMVTRSR